MAKPKLEFKNGRWYRNNLLIKNLDEYKFYNLCSKEICNCKN